MKVDGICNFESCSATVNVTDKFKHKITIEYRIINDTKQYTKEVVTIPTDKEKMEKENALKKGIPFEYKFKITEKTSGEWKFIECTGRK